MVDEGRSHFSSFNYQCILGAPQGLWGTRELAVFINRSMGTRASLSKEFGNKVDSEEQFGIYFRGTVQKNFGNEGDFGNFFKEHRPLGASYYAQSQ